MHTEITIHADQVIGKPNPKMWGIFYEEINHAGDGGLYAELIQNRSFADSRLPEGTVYAQGVIRTKQGHTEDFDPTDPLPGWSLCLSPSSIGSMDLITTFPRNPECPEQLRLSVMEPGKWVRAENSGYWGIPVKKQDYYGYCILRGEKITSAKVGLLHANGTVLCSETISVKETFEKVSFRFSSTVETSNARFFIEVNQPGCLYLDFVTLFPEDTDQNRPFGFRKDLMEMLRQLHPGFLRFPGGCVVEGITLDNAIHWKKTRGPMEDRPGHWDLWGYRATDGLGMLEFCQLAEDLNADIMYVVNCGMSCQGRKSQLGTEEEIEYWLQNALDGIEYICGDTSTTYGALRASDGHPAPFSLKYVEIGNENSGEEYHRRYLKFYHAIKEKYPDLILIANERVPEAPMDMVDDHYYTTPQQFPTMSDAYEEDGVPVYVGEYACNTQVDYGNLLGAVSDATFMIRMENRCDRIQIASYAPLFCNDHDRKWPVNLINFDGTHVFGIPSYEVQKLFGEYRVDQVFNTDQKQLDGIENGVSVTAGQKDGKYIVKMANFSTQPADVTIGLKGGALKAKEMWLLASSKEQDTNSLLYPDLVKAMPVPVEDQDGKGIVSLPPYSFALFVAEPV